MIVVKMGHSQELLPKDFFLFLVESNADELRLAAQDQSLAAVYVKEVRSLCMPRLSGTSGYQRNLIIPQIFMEFPDFNTLEIDPVTGKSTIQNSFQGFDANLRNNFHAQASLRQTLFNLKALSGLQAARIYKRISDLEFKITRKKLLLEAEILYVQAILLQQTLEVEINQEESAKINYNHARENNETGILSTLELHQAEISYEEMQSFRINTQTSYEFALAGIKQLAGIDNSKEIILSMDTISTPSLAHWDTIDLADMLSARSDYQVALLTKSLRKKEIDSHRFGFIPVIDTELQYVFSSQSNRLRLHENDFDALVLGVQVHWNIYSGGERSAAVQRAKIEYKKAELLINQSRKTIEAEMNNTLSKLKGQRDLALIAYKLFSTSLKSLEMIKLSTEAGISSQKDLRQARLENQKYRVNYLQARLNFEQAFLEWKNITSN